MARFLVAIFLVFSCWSARADDGHQVVDIEGGRYHAYAPAGWDGYDDLPVLVFFHGLGQNGGLVMRNRALRRLVEARGILLIAPSGQDGRWGHQGSPSRHRLRDDDAFIAALLEDVRRRWPVDTNRVWASGFSIGGSMTWHLACYSGHLFTAYLPIAGAFWRPHPPACPSGPVNLAHAHGTADRVVPMTGRKIRRIYQQGDVRIGIGFWRRKNACAEAPTSVEEVADLQCEIWQQCGTGREVQLCLHDGEHRIPANYLPHALDWAQAVTGRS